MSNLNKTNEVFEQISKKMKYGAPELKQLYRQYVIRSLLISVSISVCLSVLSFGYILWAKEKVDKDIETPDRILTPIDLEMQQPIDKIIPEFPKDVALKDLSALAPEPVAKKLVTEEIKLKSQNELDRINVPVASIGTDDPSKVTADFTGNVEEKKVDVKIEKKEEKKKDTFEPFEVEKAPVAVNLGSIKGSMKYPEIARQSGIEGMVVAKVLVGTDGSVVKVGGISGDNVFHDEVADKVMNLQFTPALQSGKPVKCWVSVPFSFSLNGNGKKKTDHGDN